MSCGPTVLSTTLLTQISCSTPDMLCSALTLLVSSSVLQCFVCFVVVRVTCGCFYNLNLFQCHSCVADRSVSPCVLFGEPPTFAVAVCLVGWTAVLSMACSGPCHVEAHSVADAAVDSGHRQVGSTCCQVQLQLSLVSRLNPVVPSNSPLRAACIVYHIACSIVSVLDLAGATDAQKGHVVL